MCIKKAPIVNLCVYYGALAGRWSRRAGVAVVQEDGVATLCRLCDAMRDRAFDSRGVPDALQSVWCRAAECAAIRRTVTLADTSTRAQYDGRRAERHRGRIAKL